MLGSLAGETGEATVGDMLELLDELPEPADPEGDVVPMPLLEPVEPDEPMAPVEPVAPDEPVEPDDDPIEPLLPDDDPEEPLPDPGVVVDELLDGDGAGTMVVSSTFFVHAPSASKAASATDDKAAV